MDIMEASDYSFHTNLRECRDMNSYSSSSQDAISVWDMELIQDLSAVPVRVHDRFFPSRWTEDEAARRWM